MFPLIHNMDQEVDKVDHVNPKDEYGDDNLNQEEGEEEVDDHNLGERDTPSEIRSLGNYNSLFHALVGLLVRVLVQCNLLALKLHGLVSSWFLFQFCAHILLFQCEDLLLGDQTRAAGQKQLH